LVFFPGKRGLAKFRPLSFLPPAVARRLNAFSRFQSTHKLQHSGTLIVVQFVCQMNQCRNHDVLVSNVFKPGLTGNVQPEFMNEVNLFVRKIRWVRPEIKVLNLFGRLDHAEAYALLRLIRQSFPRLAK